MAFELTYAGVNLVLPTPELQAAIAYKFPGHFVDASAWSGWPGSGFAGLAQYSRAHEFPNRLGSLFWPTGVSRFAIYLGLVDKVGAAAIRNAIQPSGTSTAPVA